ncbi:MAG TPA: hypothetical protein VFS28_01190 [Gemmatimonadales bacterium]|nr:hypothetical protein [Gemmatimonadales bacterium]
MIRRAAAAGLAVVLAAPPLAQWFSTTMERHQLLQVPALVLLGVAAGHGSRGRPPRPGADWDTALVVLAVGAMMFWMLPRSIDFAASDAVGDQLMHLSWFLAAAALAHALPRIPFAVAMALGIHGVAMLAAVGLVYRYYPGLLCTAYNLQQQRATGRIMVSLAPMLGVGLWGWAGWRAERRT